MQHLLEIDSVNKSFGQNMVLTDIYLKCETGDIIGMLGSNGSGKSTLLRILFGCLSAEQKFIRIDGKIFNRPFLTLGEIAYLPQESFIPQNMTLARAAKLYLQDDNRVNMFFDDSALNIVRYSKASQVSGGELRYAEIKLLLNIDVKFVLLDEPFNGISPLNIESVKNMIRKSAQHRGIILTDHDYRNVIDVANRHYLMYDGGIKIVRDKDDLALRGYMSTARAEKLML
jgi:ABC-type lipopolysaccharide export system ATPase subunit